MLIVNRCNHGVLLQLGDVGPSNLIELFAGELQPRWERVAADDGRAQGTWLHGIFLARSEWFAQSAEHGYFAALIRASGVFPRAIPTFSGAIGAICALSTNNPHP